MICRHDFSRCTKVNYRNGAANTVGDIRGLVVRVDRHATGLFTDSDFGHLVGDVIALRVFDLNDGHTVCLTIDDDEALSRQTVRAMVVEWLDVAATEAGATFF